MNLKPIHLFVIGTACSPLVANAVRMNCYQDFEHSDSSHTSNNTIPLVLRIRESRDSMSTVKHLCILSDSADIWKETRVHGSFPCKLKTSEEQKISFSTVGGEIVGEIDSQHGHIEKDPSGRNSMSFHGHVDIKSTGSSSKDAEYQSFLFDCFFTPSLM